MVIFGIATNLKQNKMDDLKTKYENRETEIQRAYDNTRFRLIELNQMQCEITQKIKDQERIIGILKRRASQQGMLHIL